MIEPTRRLGVPLLPGALLLLTAPLAAAQWTEPDCQSLFEHESGANGDLFGFSVEVLGDVDGDGVADFAAAAPFFGPSGGRVSAHSGKDGVMLWQRSVVVGSAILGFALEAVSDLDGDGVGDVVASAAFWDEGRVFGFSGVDGSTLFTLIGASPGDTLGYSIAAGGDYDGDGTPDLAIGATGVDVSGPNAGQVIVYTTSGMTPVATIDPPAGDSRFGAGLGFVGDIDGDQRDELAVGVRLLGDDPPGRVRVYGSDGVTDVLRYTIDQISMGTGIQGDYIDAGADVNGDGIGDILAGQPGSGVADVYSGKDGALLLSLTGNGTDSFGTGNFIPDISGDGRPDLAIGARGDASFGQNSGKVYLHRGSDGALLRTMTYTTIQSSFGADIEYFGDVNGDGEAEFLVGASAGSLWGKGRVFLMSGKPCVAAFTSYGAGLAGSLGVPTLSLSAPPVLGAAVQLIAASSSASGGPGLLVVGVSDAMIPTSWGGMLLVTPAAAFPVAIPSGGLAVPFVMPDDADLCGRDLYLQVLQGDAGAPAGVSESPGLLVTPGG